MGPLIVTAFIDIHDLNLQEMPMKPCPLCQSEEVYQYKKYFRYTGVGEELLPKAGSGLFGVAEICPVVCVSCGLIRFFASEEAREKLKKSEHWNKVQV